ncbi:FAD binding domain-containing protein [Actinophytocola sp.]|uniref:FAD binding domain-containing protein n=1 Tax=Actinophytocola sp. TaxID=1872138 RepID=UPI0025C5398B|nr:FAD binding domain-containing protein [Actinophytocola sp.]
MLARPQTLAEACTLAAERGDDAKFVSGGTAVVLMLTQGLIAPETLISLDGLRGDAALPGWTAAEGTPGELVIGGGMTLADVARDPLVRDLAPSLAHAASMVGNVRIRNVATLGGNVAEADYASDPPCVLVSLGAELDVVGPEGRRTIPAREMFLDFYTTALATGEVLTAIRVPRHPRASADYLKFCSVSAEDRPCVGVATVLELTGDGEVVALDAAIGAVGSVPQRFEDVLSDEVGRVWSAEIASRVAQEYARRITPMDDARGSRAYRGRLIDVLVRRSLATVAREQEARRGA